MSCNYLYISTCAELFLRTTSNCLCSILTCSPVIPCGVGPLEDALGAGHVCREDHGGVPVSSVPGGDEPLCPHPVLQLHVQHMLVKAILFRILQDVIVLMILSTTISLVIIIVRRII